MTLSEQDLRDLEDAVYLLENPGFAARASNAIGWPIEKALSMLPRGANDIIGRAGEKSIQQAMNFALLTLSTRQERTRSADFFHKVMVGTSGGVGGAFGLSSLMVELPISTTIMLRSIADIARSEGEKLREAEARLACVEVFALGGKGSGDDASESGYWAVRATMARMVSDAARFVVEKGVVKEGAPVLVRLVGAVAARFQIPLTQKVAAQAIPLVGAVGGAGVNLLFIDHFQDMARGHFIVRRLERDFGEAEVRGEYGRILARMKEGG